MGLDMYLNRKTYIYTIYKKPEEGAEPAIVLSGPAVAHIKAERISEISEEVGYWRKANQIHQWFVKNVQGGVDECQTTEVSLEQLQELSDAVAAVLADHSLAEELLPTQSGFFFGGTEYDEWYFEGLELTKEILDPILAEGKLKVEGADIYYTYHSSW